MKVRIVGRTENEVVGYYLNTKDYVEECRRQGQMDVQYFGFKLPESVVPNFVAVLPHGRVWGESGCVLAPNQKILWDVSREWADSPASHSIFGQTSLPKCTYIPETVAVLSKIGCSNYYHWMFDVLPRIHLLRLSPVSIDKYIVPHPLAPFQLETLAALGIRQEQLLEGGADFLLEAKRLVVPSLPLEAKWACDFVRRHMLCHVRHSPSRSKRLYISRERCVGRKVVNEPELLATLVPLGFEKIIPESMTVAEQVAVFSQAEVIVGPQGASFTNAFFCRPKTHIIEFMAPTFFITATEKISSYLNLNYHRMMGVSQRNPRYLDNEWYWHGLDNITVDVEGVLRVVKTVV